MTEQTTTTTDREADYARLLKQASGIATGASVIGFGIAVYQAVGVQPFLSIFLSILLAVAAFATDVAKLMIRMDKDGAGTPQRVFTMIFAKVFLAAIVFTIFAIFI